MRYFRGCSQCFQCKSNPIFASHDALITFAIKIEKTAEQLKDFSCMRNLYDKYLAQTRDGSASI